MPRRHEIHGRKLRDFRASVAYLPTLCRRIISFKKTLTRTLNNPIFSPSPKPRIIVLHKKAQEQENEMLTS